MKCNKERRKKGTGIMIEYILDGVTSSGILKAKQKLGVTFNSDELGDTNFTKFSKLTMCSGSEFFLKISDFLKFQ